MKKLNVLTRMLLLVALLVGSVSTWGETAGYTPSSALSSSTGTVTGTAGEKWSYSITWHQNTYYGYGASYGWQIGAGDASGGVKRGCKAFSISTSDIEGTITKIEVEAGSYGGNSKINVTVGGSDFGTQNQSTYSGQGALKSTFTGTASGEIVISATDAVRAFYLKSIKVTYTPPSLVKPTFSPAAGAVAYGKSVSLSQEDNKTIKYTTDGTDPTISSPEYTTPFVITGDITIKAIAVDGENTSSVATASYSVKTPDAPSFSKTGEVKAGALITLSQADDEMIIYTTDGSDPSWDPLNGTDYTEPIAVNEDMTIKAIAVDGAENVSSIASENYTIGHGVTIQGRLVTFDFSKSAIWEFPSDYVTDEATYDSDGYAIKFGASSNGHKILGSGIIMGKEGATLTLPGFGFKVYKIKVYGQDGASGKVTMNFYVVDEEVETAVSTSATSSLVDHEFVINSSYRDAGNKYIFKVTNGNNAQIKKIEVYGMAEAAFTPARYATFSSVNNLDFTGVEGLTAYKATATSESSVTLEEVTGVVPAETGLLLKAENNTSYYIPVSTADPTAIVTDNLLQSTASAQYEVTGSESGTAYVFGKLVDEVGFFKAATGKTIGVGKSWLLVPNTGAKDVEFLSFVFGDEESETTTIKAVVNEQAREGVYDLQGRKVTNPTKGLYIVNGKKVIRK